MPIQVIGNVKKNGHHLTGLHDSALGRSYSQLQQCQIGVAIIGPLVTLGGNIFLEDVCGLGVVSVESVEDGVDMLGPFRRIVERDAHLWMLLRL